MSKKSIWIPFFAAIAVIFTVISFYQSRPPTRPIELIIQEQIEKKIRQYRLSKQSKCISDIMAEADKIVDSLLVDYAMKHSKMKSLNRPTKKLRPGLPNLNLPDSFIEAIPFISQDSLILMDSVAPILPDSIPVDSSQLQKNL